MINKARKWFKKNNKLYFFCLSFFASLTFFIDYTGSDKFWKSSASVLMPVLVFGGVLYLVKENQKSKKDKRFFYLSFIFSICQIVAALYNRNNSFSFAFSSAVQVVKVLFVFVGYAICFYQILKYVSGLLQSKRKNPTCKSKFLTFIFEKHPFLIGFSLIMLAYIPLLFVSYPGIVQNDTFDEFSQYYCIQTWSNDYIVPEYEDSCINTHHSPFHTMIVGFINDSVYNMTGKANYALFANVIVQALMAVIVFAYTLKLMKDLGVPYWLRLLMLILYAFLPYFNLWAITLAKDVPFSLMVMLYTCFLIEFFVLKRYSWRSVTKIIASSILLLLLSNKSIFFIAPISLLMLFGVKVRYKVVMAVVPVVFYFVYSLVLLPVFHVNSGSIREPLALPIQQVSSVVKDHLDELSDDERKAVGGILEYDRISELYSDTTIDPVKNNLFNKNYNQDDVKDFLKTWFSLGWKYPSNYVSSFLHLYSVNLWIEGNNGVAYFRTERSRDYEKLDFRVRKWRKEKMNDMEAFYNDLKKAPFVGLLFHNAFYLWLLVILFVMMLRKKSIRKNVLIVFLPAIVVALFLFVSPVANNKRYFLPMIYCIPVLLAYFIYDGETIDENGVIDYNSGVKKKIRDFISFVLSPAKLVYGWIVFHIFWRLPLENKVVFSCFSGKRYGDSPKYISTMLHKERPKIKQVWICDKEQLAGMPKYVKQVKRRSLEMIKELATAKVWVDSHYQPRWVLKRRRGQFFIQTWHGGIGFKKIGLDAAQRITLVELMNLKSTAKKVDVWVTDSDWSVSVHRKANNYKGDFLRCGLPRMDYLMESKSEAKNRVCRFYKISNKKKIVLYVPTMRYNPGKNDFMVDVDGVLGALHKSFGGEWVFIIRLHPVNQDAQKRIVSLYNSVYDGVKYDDVQDLIAGADVCISDYSSAVFDSAILRHPTFCFAFDEDKYEEKERGFYQKPEELPFPVARDNTELIESIAKFDKERYKKELNEYFGKVGLYDARKATEKVAAIIWEKINENK